MEPESANGSGSGFDLFGWQAGWKAAREAGCQVGCNRRLKPRFRIAAPIAESAICRHTYVTWRSERAG